MAIIKLTQVSSEDDVGLLQLFAPCLHQHTSHALVKVSGIGHEGGRQDHISDYGGHLCLECLAACLPSHFLTLQTAQQGSTSGHLSAIIQIKH